jgi:hypothetical protein
MGKSRLTPVFLSYVRAGSHPARRSPGDRDGPRAPPAALHKYHQPADKLDDSWNFDGVIEDAQLAMFSTWLIAQADAMPAWKPGDEFEAARKRALAEIGQ